MQILKQIQIPYSFAKRHGVLLRYEGDQVFIVRRQGYSAIALQEARRILGKSAQHQFVMIKSSMLTEFELCR
jgi:general secretion pathway protein E